MGVDIDIYGMYGGVSGLGVRERHLDGWNQQQRMEDEMDWVPGFCADSWEFVCGGGDWEFKA